MKPIPHLPPGPYGWQTTAPQGDHRGAAHVYLTDANGRKIASIWGRPDEKLALVALIQRADRGYRKQAAADEGEHI